MLMINLHSYVEHSIDVHPPIAIHTLGLMVRGIFGSLHFPYAHFATSNNFTGENLFLILWEAIEWLPCCSIYLINLFVELTHYLLNLPCTTGHYLLIKRFSQDPLENNFRQPYNASMHSVGWVTTSAREHGNGSCPGNSSRKKRFTKEIIGHTPLPKRPRHKWLHSQLIPLVLNPECREIYCSSD